jgi:hypothetical protein
MTGIGSGRIEGPVSSGKFSGVSKPWQRVARLSRGKVTQLRLDRPYTARHLPWYLHAGNTKDEHRYYFSRVQTPAHWGSRLIDLLQLIVSEEQFMSPTADCPHPEYWSATDARNPEQEVGDFVRGWVRLAQPERCLAIAPRRGEVSRAIARALRDNGHGTLTVVTPDDHDRTTNGLLCDRTPTMIKQEDPREFETEHDYQIVWIASGVPVTPAGHGSTDRLAMRGYSQAWDRDGRTGSCRFDSADVGLGSGLRPSHAMIRTAATIARIIRGALDAQPWRHYRRRDGYMVMAEFASSHA